MLTSSFEHCSSACFDHDRIVLLFDLDCFYAQCERVRLGLPEDVSLALLQWNSVLAVTYPARKFGIQRGDTFDAVAEKSQNKCWAIHLNVLDVASANGAATNEGTTGKVETTIQNPCDSTSESTTISTTNNELSDETTAKKTTIQNPYANKPKLTAQNLDRKDTAETATKSTILIPHSNTSNSTTTTTTTTTNTTTTTTTTLTSAMTTNTNDEEDDAASFFEPQGPALVANVEDAYNQIYKLSREEQLECQKRERGVRRMHNEGKACLERYRLASMRIFTVVLESLSKRLGGKDKFILERASIDEFYLDITNYCYKESTLTTKDLVHKTVMVGEKSDNPSYSWNAQIDSDLQGLALQRACQVAYWIRDDVLRILGFTMSAGICTNKMMAKLAASYGKPNGQAVLHPQNFPILLGNTKIRKVRHFGGKLGRQVLKVLQEQSPNPAKFDRESATMAELQQVPLPVLQKYFSEETANFVFQACRGVDGEAVKETTGALVKSITAFKTFSATSNLQEIQNWLSLMAAEVITRVAKDSARNHRYPKTCTLNYTYYDTETGKRPNGASSARARSFSKSKSIRLNFPHENDSNKVQDLVQQSLQKLHPILKEHPLRGVGLSANNFETRGCPPDGVKGILTFFAKRSVEGKVGDGNTAKAEQVLPLTNSTWAEISTDSKRGPDFENIVSKSPHTPLKVTLNTINEKEDPGYSHMIPLISKNNTSNHTSGVHEGHPAMQHPSPKRTRSEFTPLSQEQAREDEKLAKRLQASFNRENYILSAVNRFRRGNGATSSRSKAKGKPPTSEKVQRIDAFFGRK